MSANQTLTVALWNVINSDRSLSSKMSKSEAFIAAFGETDDDNCYQMSFASYVKMWKEIYGEDSRFSSASNLALLKAINAEIASDDIAQFVIAEAKGKSSAVKKEKDSESQFESMNLASVATYAPSSIWSSSSESPAAPTSSLNSFNDLGAAFARNAVPLMGNHTGSTYVPPSSPFAAAPAGRVTSLADFVENATTGMDVIDLAEFFRIHAPELLQHYSITVWARAILYCCNQIDKQYPAIQAPSMSFEHLQKAYGLASSALQRGIPIFNSAQEAMSGRVSVKKIDTTPEQFCQNVVREIEDNILFNGNSYLDCNASPLFQVSREFTGKKQVLSEEDKVLFTELGLATLQDGPRRIISVDIIFQGVPTKCSWTMTSQAEAKLIGCAPKLLTTVQERFHSMRGSGFRVTGVMTMGRARMEMRLYDFVTISSNSFLEGPQKPQMQREFWKTVRSKTIYDREWFKHDYVFMQNGTSILPYCSTAIKFLDAYSWLVPKLRKIETPVAIVYAGVTSNGSNTQLAAAEKLFSSIWGNKIFGDVDKLYRQDAKWMLYKYDIVANAARGTTKLDAADINSVLQVNSVTRDYKNVICILDLSGEEVTATTNSQASKYIESFSKLERVAWITSKYDASAEITLSGVKDVVPLTSQLFAEKWGPMMPVGRGHGSEGIIYVTPGSSSGKKIFCPFATASKANGDPDVMARYLHRVHKSSWAQFAPQPILKLPDVYREWIPETLAVIGKTEVVAYAFGSTELFGKFDDNSDEEAKTVVAAPKTFAEEK